MDPTCSSCIGFSCLVHLRRVCFRPVALPVLICTCLPIIFQFVADEDEETDGDEFRKNEPPVDLPRKFRHVGTELSLLSTRCRRGRSSAHLTFPRPTWWILVRFAATSIGRGPSICDETCPASKLARLAASKALPRPFGCCTDVKGTLEAVETPVGRVAARGGSDSST